MAKEIPVGVKIIAILYFIGAILSLFAGIGMFIGAGPMSAIPLGIPGLTAMGAGLFIGLGLLMIGLAVLGFFVGLGLWKGQAWARIVAIILAILGIISAIISMIGGNVAANIVGLIINLVVGAYLIMNNEVKKVFS